MGVNNKYSIFLRIVCGILGVSGLAVTVFNVFIAKNFIFDFNLMATSFAVCIFIYVSVSGADPFENANKSNLKI